VNYSINWRGREFQKSKGHSLTPSDHLHIDFGNAIRDERIRQNLEIADMAERLRAPVEHIEAVEAGNISAFSLETYFHLFAKSYARELGIDYARTLEAMTGKEELTVEEENISAENPAPYSQHRPIARSHNPQSIFQRPGVLFVILAIITGGLLGVAKLVRNSNEAGGEGKAMEAGMNNTFDTLVKRTGTDSTFAMHFSMTTTDSSFIRVLADGDTIVAETVKPGQTFAATAKNEIALFADNPGAVACSINGHRALYDSTNPSGSIFVVNPGNIHSKLEIRRSPFAPAEMLDRMQTPTSQPADSSRTPLGGTR
jgi:transcriptional regulator with XRE-family HTH domain